MVFFVCDGCQETLKKRKVEVHRGHCRGAYIVSCVDCSIRFEGDQYKAHTSCISEAEKYEKKLFQGKNKGSKLSIQDRWTLFLSNLNLKESKEQRQRLINKLLHKLLDFDNVPRKEKKFKNFVKNSFYRTPDNLINQTWIYLNNKFQETEQNRIKEVNKQAVKEKEKVNNQKKKSTSKETMTATEKKIKKSKKLKKHDNKKNSISDKKKKKDKKRKRKESSLSNKKEKKKKKKREREKERKR